MKQRYLLDNENLIFQEEQLSFKQRVKFLLKYVFSGFLMALVVWPLFYTGILNSPKKHFLQQLNDNLVSEVNSVNSQFDSISADLSHFQKRDDYVYRVISQIAPIPASVRAAGFGGTNKYKYLDGFDNSDLLIESIKKGDILLNQLHIQSKSYDTIIYFARNKEDSLLSVPGISPLAPSEYFRISDPFGRRIHPISGKEHIHTGIDFAANKGNTVYCSGNGKVESVQRINSGYGNHVIVNHGYGFKTLYAHLSKIFVKEGDEISRGHALGAVGSTGTSTGPHLHYEVIYNNGKIDPKYFYIEDLSDEEFKEMIALLAGSN